MRGMAYSQLGVSLRAEDPAWLADLWRRTRQQGQNNGFFSMGRG
jgi:hypothetical protein